MALALAQQLGNTISACVLIDPTVPRAKGKPGKYAKLLEEMRYPEGAEILLQFLTEKMLNPETDLVALIAEKLFSMVSRWKTAPAQFTKLLSDVSGFDSGHAIAKCPCPLLYIAGTPSFADLSILKKLNVKIDIQSLRSGHFVMLNQPGQVNDCIENFIA